MIGTNQRQRLPFLFFRPECKIVVVALAGSFSTHMYCIRVEVGDEVNENIKAVALFQSEHPLQR
jgi:hypothetical protein